jgi:two-component system chemotaxis response regulator CheY
MTKPTKILAVDDSRTMRRLLRMAVETIGYEMLEAGNGGEALEVLLSNGEAVALVLLDWNMPIMNGMETLQALKQDERFKSIPVMMVTTEGDRLAVIEAIRNGAHHYLTKPFTQQELAVRMLECLGRGPVG